MLFPSTVDFSKGRVLGAVVAAAFVAAVLVQVDGTPRAAPSPVVAGEAMMHMLGDEHAAIAGYVKQEAAARTQADQMAARDFENMKLASLAEAQPAGLRLAQAVMPAREEKPKVSVVRVAAKSEMLHATSGSAVAGEPMQLLAMTDMQAPLPRGLVRGRLHQLASTVERIPSWFSSAAGWVVEIVPVPRMSLPQFPMRHFRV